MMLSHDEGMAIIISLEAAAGDHAIREKKAIAAADTVGARIAGAFAHNAGELAKRFRTEGIMDLTKMDGEIITAALRLRAMNYMEVAKRDFGPERAKRLAFGSTFANLADRISAEIGRAPALKPD
jgi:hypothetical protein